MALLINRQFFIFLFAASLVFEGSIFAQTTADLALTETVSDTAVTVNSTYTYTLTVENKGPQGADGVTLTDLLQPELALSSAAASQGSCAGAPSLVCDLGTLADGDTATGTLSVAGDRARNGTNSASVTSQAADPDPSNDTVTSQTTRIILTGGGFSSGVTTGCSLVR